MAKKILCKDCKNFIDGFCKVKQEIIIKNRRETIVDYKPEDVKECEAYAAS